MYEGGITDSQTIRHVWSSGTTGTSDHMTIMYSTLQKKCSHQVHKPSWAVHEVFVNCCSWTLSCLIQVV